MDVRELYEKVEELVDKEVTLQGWIKNIVNKKNLDF